MSSHPFLVESLSADQIATVEATMRNHSFSQAGFLGRDESLVDRVRNDDEILRRQGISHDQIADRLEALSGRAERVLRLLYRSGVESDGEGLLVEEGRYEVELIHYSGWQECPFQPGDPRTGTLETCGSATTDVEVRRTSDGATLFFSELLIHLVRDHHFFEGSGLPYRLEPEEAIRVLDIHPGVSYRARVREEMVWQFHRELDPGDLPDADQACRVEILSPGVRAFLLGEATCVVQAEGGLPLGNLRFDGVPFTSVVHDGISRWTRDTIRFLE